MANNENRHVSSPKFGAAISQTSLPENGIGKECSPDQSVCNSDGLLFLGAGKIHSYSVNSLYTWSAPDEVYLSVGRFTDQEFQELIEIANNDSEVQIIISAYKTPGNRCINYVMPTDLLISEVPMLIPDGKTPSHSPPHREDQSRYKIIYTLADFGPADPADNLDILKRAINKTPILEAWIDRINKKVENIIEPPEHEIYFGMPVPLF